MKKQWKKILVPAVGWVTILVGCAQLGDLGRAAGLANLGLVALCPKEQLEVVVRVEEDGQLGEPTLGCADPAVAVCEPGEVLVGVVFRGDGTVESLCEVSAPAASPATPGV